MTLRITSTVLFALTTASLVAGCVVGDAVDDSDGNGDDGEGVQSAASSPMKVNIGFNGDSTEFEYWPDWKQASVVQPGNRVCHTYVEWNAGYAAPNTGGVTTPGSRAYVDHWLSQAKGNCDEVLIAFKSSTPRAAVDEVTYTKAFVKFASNDWSTETGYTGAITYSTWNEPNNRALPATGSGCRSRQTWPRATTWPPSTRCKQYGCNVVAGDFATNDMWDDLEWELRERQRRDVGACASRTATRTRSTCRRATSTSTRTRSRSTRTTPSTSSARVSGRT